MRSARRMVFDAATRLLTRPRRRYQLVLPHSPEQLRATLQKGDVVLVDGEQRVSEVIKYLTQSSWSHSALYVGDELWRRFPERRSALTAEFGADAQHLMVEALMEGGVIASPVGKYARQNLRVCRPRGLRQEHLQRIVDEVLAQLGSRYDVKNILDLARYFFPVSLIPRGLRQRALELGSGLTTEVICSSLIGRAYQNVGFPILPMVTPGTAAPARSPGGWRRWLERTPEHYPVIFHRQKPKLITPRDFDLSPYFEVVKLGATEARQFDYRRIRWA